MQQLSGLTALLVGPVVTVWIWVAVVQRWSSFSWWNRAIAVGLLLNMAILPLQSVFSKKLRGNLLVSLGTSEAFTAYLWVFLMALLFVPGF
jgi:hypothetical protein